jgi:hypothetical protein
VEGLLYYGLISEEQAAEASRRFEREWDKALEDSRWWYALARIAWSLRPWHKRVFGLPMTWQGNWIRERRGW